MIFYYPVFHEEKLYILKLTTSPLLKGPPITRVMGREFELEEGPPFELVGFNFWNKAYELGSLGRILEFELAFLRGSQIDDYDLGISLLSQEKPGAAPLRLLSRFRPPIEVEDPKIFIAFGVTDSGHTPLGFSPQEREQIKGFLKSHPLVSLMHASEAKEFTQRDPSLTLTKSWRNNSPPNETTEFQHLSAWRISHWLKSVKPPYPLEKSILSLPPGSWLKATAESLGMLPLKWVGGGGYFQGSPASCSWGDALRAVAPSLGITGDAKGLFPVPIISGSLLDNVLGTHRKDFFLDFSTGKETFFPDRHVLLCGPTGTGKTLLGTLALINECLERGSPVVYLGPTRMLVEDAALEFLRIIEAIENEVGHNLINRDDILISTGEAFLHDNRIALGDFRAAFVVYEKVSNFFLSSNLLDYISLALVDELHMLGDRTRGGALDATLGRLLIESIDRREKNRPPLRVIGLSTGAIATDKILLDLFGGAPGFDKTPFPDLPEQSPVSEVRTNFSAGAKVRSDISEGFGKGHTLKSLDPAGLRVPLSPLLLSVYERPQRLLIYIQPTPPGVLCQAFHVGRASDPHLDLDHLVLQKSEGKKFMDTLEGWIPGHERVIYASYSGGSLGKFARWILSKGRSEIKEMLEEENWLSDLEKSLIRYGVEDNNVQFFLNCAKRGVFFHYSGLGRETRRKMAEGFRNFRPIPYEPFVLCATETIAYGVNLPADAIFLENINWPRSRYDRSLAIETLTTNEFRNLVGRVGRHGHIRPGIIPTVVINWSIGKTYEDSYFFQAKREEMANIVSSVPILAIDCRELKMQLQAYPKKSLSHYPSPVEKFYILALLHTYAISNNKPVTVNQVYEFLENTYNVRSFLRSGSAEETRRLKRNLKNYYDLLHKHFEQLVVLKSSSGPRGLERYEPKELLLNFAKNGTNPISVTELTLLIKGFSPNNLWNDPKFFGLKCLIMAPILLENRQNFMRPFIFPGELTGKILERALVKKEESLDFLNFESAPFVRLLETEEGMDKVHAQMMAKKIREVLTNIVKQHLFENYRKYSKDEKIIAIIRDNLIRQVFTLEMSQLMWIAGISVKNILKTRNEWAKRRVVKKEQNGEIDSVTSEEPLDGDLKLETISTEEDLLITEEDPWLEAQVDTRSFNYRFMDKMALVLDSYLAYGLASNNIPESSLQSLISMRERIRNGLREENFLEFKKYSEDFKINREEWLEMKESKLS
ncbi:MAG: DEAD/DEAH box helicase [Deltaproteobacteria bacterium]|jgi:hypothetical protein|nr:DEAD/DEAH box helicase [Deltaproteobacteria bacterium]